MISWRSDQNQYLLTGGHCSRVVTVTATGGGLQWVSDTFSERTGDTSCSPAAASIEWLEIHVNLTSKVVTGRQARLNYLQSAQDTCMRNHVTQRGTYWDPGAVVAVSGIVLPQTIEHIRHTEGFGDAASADGHRQISTVYMRCGDGTGDHQIEFAVIPAVVCFVPSGKMRPFPVLPMWILPFTSSAWAGDELPIPSLFPLIVTTGASPPELVKMSSTLSAAFIIRAL